MAIGWILCWTILCSITLYPISVDLFSMFLFFFCFQNRMSQKILSIMSKSSMQTCPFHALLCFSFHPSKEEILCGPFWLEFVFSTFFCAFFQATFLVFPLSCRLPCCESECCWSYRQDSSQKHSKHNLPFSFQMSDFCFCFQQLHQVATSKIVLAVFKT